MGGGAGWAPALGRGVGLVVMLGLGIEVAARGVALRRPGLLLGVLDGANFIFHEGGHVVFGFLGAFMSVLGGSLVQVALPAACVAYFWRAGQPAAAAATLFWAGESLTHVAVYVADAETMRLPLHGGPGVIHDWNYLLGRAGLLGWAAGLGRAAFIIGMLSILLALGWLALDLRRALMRRSGEPG